jgi:acetylornithine deacetylase
MNPDQTTSSRALLERLISFATISDQSNLPLVDFIEDHLSKVGAKTRRVPSADGRKSNLMAWFGPQDAPGGVILSGHTDVVPIEGQSWTSDPFTLTERDGRLYGRGTCDMKGFIACALSAAPLFARTALEAPILFAFSYDEEVGCYGAPAMIDEIVADFAKPLAVIIGEPSEMKVITGHKGLHGLEFEIIGKAAHSSLVENGACANTYAIPLLAMLHEEARAMRAAAPHDSRFDPPYGTLTIGQIKGGTADNILAERCHFYSLMRPAPWDDTVAFETRLLAKAAEIEAEMKIYAPQSRVHVRRASFVPPLGKEVQGRAEELARALTGDNMERVVSYGTEAGQFQHAGISTVVCGPGSIAQAHQPDEFIAVSELEACDRFMKNLARRMRKD